MVSVAFVCLGNICRSPMAEAVFAHSAKLEGIDVKTDSFGTCAAHIGSDPDRRTVKVCRAHDIPIDHSAQQIFPHHFEKFDYILAMDRDNLSRLKDMAPRSSTATVALFGDYRQDKSLNRIVDDPYYGGDSGFERAYTQLIDFSKGLLKDIESKA